MYKEAGVGGIGGLLIGVFWAQIALSIALIGLRIYTRSFIRGSVGWDDVCLISTLVLNTGFTVFTTVAAVHGMHRWFLWFCAVSMVIMSIFLAVTVLAQCTPAKSIWNPELANQRVCHLSLTVVAITYCSYAAAMDFILAGFLWIALHGLNIKPKERHTICLSLSLGVFAGICGIFRTTGLTSLSNSQDYLYAISDSVIWTANEVTATIVCLTLPASARSTRRSEIRNRVPQAINKTTTQFTQTTPPILLVLLEATRLTTGRGAAGQRSKQAYWLVKTIATKQFSSRALQKGIS
ncbi:hypothetical protein ACKRZS_005785 [Fusarium odoratissimum]